MVCGTRYFAGLMGCRARYVQDGIANAGRTVNDALRTQPGVWSNPKDTTKGGNASWPPNLSKEVLETLEAIDKNPSSPPTIDQTLQIAQIKALIAIARAVRS